MKVTRLTPTEDVKRQFDIRNCQSAGPAITYQIIPNCAVTELRLGQRKPGEYLMIIIGAGEDFFPEKIYLTGTKSEVSKRVKYHAEYIAERLAESSH